MFRLLLFTLVMSFGFSSQASECGVFRVVKGKVSFQQKNKSKFRKARINKKVCSGDRIRTDTNSRAKIVMAGDNEINVNPKSEVLIEKYKDDNKTGDKQVLLNVIYGKIRSNVKQKYKDDKQSFYRVKTKSAVAGVRGTEFVVGFDAATKVSKVVTFEGKVSVSNFDGSNMVTVGPGQFTSNKRGKSPHKALKMPKKEFVKIDQETSLPGDKGPADREISNDPGAPMPSEEDQQKEEPILEPGANEEQPPADGDNSAGGPTMAPGENREPASVNGDANDFDNLVDREIADVELDPSTGGIGFDPTDLPEAPPVVDPTTVTGLPNYQAPPQTTDQLLNQSVNLSIGICIQGTPGCP